MLNRKCGIVLQLSLCFPWKLLSAELIEVQFLLFFVALFSLFLLLLQNVEDSALHCVSIVLLLRIQSAVDILQLLFYIAVMDTDYLETASFPTYKLQLVVL